MMVKCRVDRKKAGGRFSQGKPLVDRLKAGAAVLAISLTGCTMNTGGISVIDGAIDTREDTAVIDLKRPDMSIDSKAAADLSPDKLPDMRVDSKVPDNGVDMSVPDQGSDIGADMGPDSGVVCSGVTNDSVTTKLINTGKSVIVGGYEIKNNGPASGGITVDIRCASSSSLIKSSIFCNAGGPETIVGVPADGKKIRLYNLNNNASAASMTINVETL